MRKRSLPWILLLLLSVFTYIACQKEYRPGFPLDPANPPSEKVTASISGRVINERQEPVEGAIVTAGNVYATTNYNGYFNLENATVASDAAFIKVQMQGYFPGSRTIMAREDGSHYIQVELIPIEKTGEFAATSGGTVSFPQGGSAIFPAGAIVREADGSAYTGRVDVNQFFIDPTTEGFTDRMPGDLKGITTGDEVVAMQSFGMMAIQLNGEGGELLQVAPGTKVDLKFPIPADLVSKAPASIPLWFFDEEKGLWREEGSATKSGSEYVGQVSHFSFWNCDVPLKFTEISFTLKDQAGNPQGNVQVQIEKKSDNTIANGFTTAEGWVKGWVPLNEPLELSVLDACGKVIHKRDIGPYSSPADLGVLTIEPTATTSFILNNASFIDCDNQYLANGYVNVYFRGRNIRMPLEGAAMSIGFSDCYNQSDSARITVYDAGQDMYITKTVLVAPGVNDLGEIQVCEGELSQFIRFQVDGKSFEFLTPVDSVVMFDLQTNHNVYGYQVTQAGSGSIQFASGSQAPYSTPLLELMLTGDSMRYYTGSNGNVNITRYGAAYEFVEGNFSGQVKDSLAGGINVPMTGSFRVRRKP